MEALRLALKTEFPRIMLLRRATPVKGSARRLLADTGEQLAL